VGGGFEYETDSEQAQYDFPFLLEYGISNKLKFTFEPNLLNIRKSAGSSVGGFGEMETSLTYDFITERRYRPGFSALGLIKWPTASHPELGTGKADFTVGMIASKEFVHSDVELDALYTLVGTPPGVQTQNTIELVLGGEWHVSRVIDLEGELDTKIGSGRFHGHPGALGGLGRRESGSETGATVGMAEHLNHYLKLEQGVVALTDGTLQAVFAWEWDFSGGD
jgi:hypothetical protein